MGEMGGVMGIRYRAGLSLLLFSSAVLSEGALSMLQNKC